MAVADATYDLCVLTPSEITLDVVGSAIEGARSLSGVTQSIDYSGGGFVAVTYAGINVLTAAQAKAWNRLAAILNGSVRTVNVPLWADLVAARHPTSGLALGAPGELPNPTVQTAVLMGATQLQLAGLGGAVIEGGEWFSIQHGSGGNIGNRAYRIAKLVTAPDVINFYPALRDDVAAGVVCDFWQPQCRMRLPAGETMAWMFRAPGGISELTVSFVETF
jgi:hypothetical protein